MTSDTEPSRVVAHIVYPADPTRKPYLVLPTTLMGVSAFTMDSVVNFVTFDGALDARFADVFDEIVLEITVVKVTPKRLTSDRRHVIDANADPTNPPDEEDDLE